MTTGLLVIALVAAVNPARFRLSLPDEIDARHRPAAVLLGAAAMLAASLGVAAVADGVLDGLDVSPETFRIAAGLIATVAGLWVVVVPRRGEEPVLPGPGAALVPVLFPLLMTPETAALLLAAGADEPFGGVAAAVAAALAAVTASGWLRRGPVVDSALTVAARLLGAALVTSGVWLMIDGIRDV